MTKDQIIEYLRQHYPYTRNDVLCKHLGMSLSALRTIASRNKIHKSKEYLKERHKDLMKSKQKAYLASIPQITLTDKELNIIVGSILGDGSLSFSPRSRNAYYREHFSIKQQEYRIWKRNNIYSLPFRIEKSVHLKSPSHPIFTELYEQFYINNRKTITKENIKMLDHPIGLSCLYLDDGTLMVDVNRKKDYIYIFPKIGLTTLCFSKDECSILINRILEVFNIKFRLNPHPDGQGYTLVCSTIDNVYKFFNVVQPYCESLKTMRYKWDIDYRLNLKREELLPKNPNSKITIASLDGSAPRYTPEDESLIIDSKKSGKTDKEIAQILNRSYLGVVDKIRRLRQAGKLV